MTNIDEQINKLNDLLAAISIESEPEDNAIENDKIVLDYSSDENPYYVKTEKPESSKNRDFSDYSDGQISRKIGGATGFIICDPLGRVVFAGGKSFQAITDPFTLECLAVRRAKLLEKLLFGAFK